AAPRPGCERERVVQRAVAISPCVDPGPVEDLVLGGEVHDQEVELVVHKRCTGGVELHDTSARSCDAEAFETWVALLSYLARDASEKDQWDSATAVVFGR